MLGGSCLASAGSSPPGWLGLPAAPGASPGHPRSAAPSHGRGHPGTRSLGRKGGSDEPQHAARPHHRREALGPAPQRDLTADTVRFGFHLISEAAVSRCYTQESRKTWGLHAQRWLCPRGACWADTHLLCGPQCPLSRVPRAALPAQLPAPRSSQTATPPHTIPIIPTTTPWEGGLGTCPWSVSLEISGCQDGVPGTEGLLTGVQMSSRAPTAGSGPCLPAVGSARDREWVFITTGHFCH